jgi:hypothetical protein
MCSVEYRFIFYYYNLVCGPDNILSFLNWSSEQITGSNVTNPKIVLGSSLGEDFGSRDNFLPSFAQMSQEVPQDTTLTNRRRDGDAYCRDADTTFHIWTADEPRDALWHEIIETTLSVATPTVATPTPDPNQAKRSIKTQYKTLTNRHRAPRRRQTIPQKAYMSLFKAQDKTLANRRRASQHL